MARCEPPKKLGISISILYRYAPTLRSRVEA
jgi:hypothetical protein